VETVVRQALQEQQAQPPQVVVVHHGQALLVRVVRVKSSLQYSQHKEKA
jgi:hypothetical protein